MASGRDIRAGKAFVELMTKNSLAKGLNAASAQLKAWGKSISSSGKWLAAAGAAITTPLTAAAYSSAAAASEMYALSRRTGMTIPFLSKLGFAADMTATDITAAERAIRMMQKTIAGVKDDMEGTTGEVDGLGLSLDALRQLSPEDQFRAVAAAVAKLPTAMERTAMAMKIFGRGGTAVIPMIERFAELEATAQQFGLVKSLDEILNAKALNEDLIIMGKAIKSVWTAVGSAIIPLLREKVQWITRILVVSRDWIKENKGIVVSIFQIGVGAVVAGTAIYAIGKGISVMGAITSALLTAWNGLGAVIGWIAANPIIALAAAVAGLATYLFVTSDYGKKAMKSLADQFGWAKDAAVTAFQGIRDALMAGDLSLAVQIVWTAIQIAWVTGLSYVKQAWYAALSWMSDVWTGWEAAYEMVIDWVAQAWVEVCATVARVWATTVGAVKSVHESAVAYMTDRWLEMMGMFDKNLDVDAAKALAAKAHADKMKAIADEQAAKLGSIEAERAAVAAALAKEHAEQLARIATEGQARREALGKDSSDELARLKAERDALLAKLKQQADEAAMKRFKGAGEQPEGAAPPAFNLEDLKGGIKDAIEARGTFLKTTAGVLGLQSNNSWQNQMLNAVQGTEKNTRKGIPVKVDYAGMAFA